MPIPLIIGAAGLAAAATAIKKGVEGYKGHAEASDILDAARKRYNEQFGRMAEAEKSAVEALAKLGELELSIGAQFHDFSVLAQELMGTLKKDGKFQDLALHIPKHKLEKIEVYSVNAIGVLGSVAGAGVAGVSAGFAVYGGVMTFAAASTGTAISTLSGAAASNAALAAIGGGAISAGGLGVAGGTALLGVAVVAPVLAVAGWAYAKHGEEALSSAKKNSQEMWEATVKAIQARSALERIEQWAKLLDSKISLISESFVPYADDLKKINAYLKSVSDLRLDPEVELQKIGDKVILAVQNGYAIAAILVDILTTPLFKVKKNGDEVVRDGQGAPEMLKDADGSMILNDEELQGVLNRSDEAMTAFAKRQ